MRLIRAVHWCAVLAALGIGCAGTPAAAPSRDQDDYLRWISFEASFNERVLLRWHERQMPLRVFLPQPPPGLFEDSESIYDSVRDGVLDWSDVAGPGLPSFVFVDDIGEADIPIVWEPEPDGSWYIAHCVYDVRPMSRRFGVARILVTGRWSPGHVADRFDIYSTVLHEMGHALGLGGHSPEPGDIMYPSISRETMNGLSDRDRATLQALYARPIGSRITGARSDP